MNDQPNPSAKALRKLRRKTENEALAKVARFWKKPGSAERLGHTRPVDRQAANELAHKPRRKPQPSN
jgi:hypothetical protein